MNNPTRREFIKGIAQRGLAVGTLSLLTPLSHATKRSTPAPALFLGHGDPLNALRDNTFTRDWDRVGKILSAWDSPTAILCVSAHWQSRQTRVSTVATPELIYDFYGFPRTLYQIQYPAPGYPGSYKLLDATSANQGILPDNQRGLDHGAWCVLSRLFPRADIPVFQLSLSRSLSPEGHYELARKIGSLRNRGVIILGSGNLTHNMRSWRYDVAHGQTHLVHDWARTFDEEVAKSAIKGDHQSMVRFAQEKPPIYRMAHPTDEHYLPLLYSFGVQNDKDDLQFFSQGFDEGSFSMRSIMISQT